MSSRQDDVLELAVNPTPSLGAVMGTDEDLAGFVHDVFTAQVLTVQVAWIICSTKKKIKLTEVMNRKSISYRGRTG